MPAISIKLANLIQGIATEATTMENLSKTEDPNVSMQLALVTDKLILKSNLKPVTDPVAFTTGGIKTPGGLFSDEIFGRTDDERRRQFAYIDLQEYFFHPFVFEILDDLMPKRFKQCAQGQGSWTITEDGTLTKVERNDPKYNEDNTGIQWLIKNFKKLSFKESGSMIRSDRIKLIKDLSHDEIFISKWLVVPVVYRDIDKNSSIHKLPELNTRYNNVIRYANSLRDSTFSFFNNQARYNLQIELVNIRKHGQTLIEKKHGFFHKAILGKSIDRGSGDVISTPSMRGYQRPEDNPIDVLHSGIPLAKCLIMGYDFVMRYCLQFFANNFRNVTEYPVYRLVGDEYKIVGSVPIEDQISRFSSKFLEKRINRFKNSHGTRFEVITLTTKDGKEIPLHLAGQFAPTAPRALQSTIINRPMTWTDLFYMAAEDTLGDKYVYITRYPVESHNHIFPSNVRVLSTIRTIPAYVNGTLYERYPYIDLSTPTERISSCFNDTITMSNLCIGAMGGDYDGDTTRSKICFSIEANAEAKEISESIRNFISPQGGLIRTLGNEMYLTFYNLTRNHPPGGPLSDDLKKELLALDRTKITVKDIARLFGSTTSMGKDKKSVFDVRTPKFNLRAVVTLEAGEYTNKTKIQTTVGKILFNKLMIEGTKLVDLVPNGFYNVEVNKKAFGKLCNMVADGVMSGQIHIIPEVNEFTRNMEFWGLNLVSIVGSSYSMETIVPNKQLLKKKEELLKAAKENGGRLADYTAVEDALTEEADHILDGTVGKYLFDSGARGSFENDFKNMAISVGAVENPITGSHDFMSSSYMSGLSKEDLPAAANSVLNAEYPKAIGTSQGGYMTKQFYAVFQNMSLDEEGSDCGTKFGLVVTLTKDNLRKYIDQYIQDGSTPILITEDLPSKYLNHPVIIRSPMYCIGERLCSVCAGRRFFKVGIDNIGLTTPALSGKLQNAALKLRHSLKIKMNTIDEKSILI